MTRRLSQPVHEVRIGRGSVWVRELCGGDELGLGGTDTASLLEWLDGLLVARPDALIQPGEAAALSVGERDRLVATLYSRIYGPQIQGTLRCQACDERFEMDFSLDLLVSSLFADIPEPTVPGRRVRYPDGADELAIRGLSVAEAEKLLARRCTLDGEPGADEAAILAALAAAPVLDVDLDAACHECQHVNVVRFSAQEFFLRALERDRRRLPTEVHLIARAYGWALSEILTLTRSQRYAFVGLLDASAPAAGAW